MVLTPTRVDPASLPAAGLPKQHDSANPDYRWSNSRQPSPSKRLQTTVWFDPPTDRDHRMKKPVELERPRPPPTPNKPDLHNVADIYGAAPSQFRGNAKARPLTPNGTMRAEEFSSCGLPNVHVNPLQPHYTWTKPSANHRAFPLGASAPAFHRGNYQTGYDVSDIPEVHARPLTLSRSTPYDNFDYSDVRGTTALPRVWQRAADPRPPVDVRKLNMWATPGDTGRMLHSKRTQNPNSPVYNIHGREVSPWNSNDRLIRFGQPKEWYPPQGFRGWDTPEPGSDEGLCRKMNMFKDNTVAKERHRSPGRTWNRLKVMHEEKAC